MQGHYRHPLLAEVGRTGYPPKKTLDAGPLSSKGGGLHKGQSGLFHGCPNARGRQKLAVRIGSLTDWYLFSCWEADGGCRCENSHREFGRTFCKHF